MKTKEILEKNLENWFNQIKSLKDLENVRITNSFNTSKKTIVFSFSVFDRRLKWTRGSSNQTNDGFFVPYFDYDCTRLGYVAKELEVLQKQFNLGNIHIFESSKNNYQAVGFDKLTFNELQNVLMFTSCDYAFITFPKYLPYAKYYVLRQFSKGKTTRPKYVKTIHNTTKRSQSLAHWKYFSILYPEIKKFPLVNSDGIEKMVIVDYPTGCNV